MFQLEKHPLYSVTKDLTGAEEMTSQEDMNLVPITKLKTAGNIRSISSDILFDFLRHPHIYAHTHKEHRGIYK